MHKIYLISNSINNKQYVGLTRQTLEKRFQQHSQFKRNYVSAMQSAMKKYDPSNFTIELIAECESLEEAGKLERLGIAYYNTLAPLGYNIRKGGQSGNFTEETKKKISASKKGKQLGDKNPMFGKTHSPEARKKISEARKGTKLSDEHLKKLNDSHTGEKNHNYGKTRFEAFGIEQSWNVGIPMTEEAKNKKTRTIFYKHYNIILNNGAAINLISEEELVYANHLLQTDLDLAVSFICEKKSSEWNYKEVASDYREMRIKFNKKVGKFTKTFNKNRKILKEAM